MSIADAIRNALGSVTGAAIGLLALALICLPIQGCTASNEYNPPTEWVEEAPPQADETIVDQAVDATFYVDIDPDTGEAAIEFPDGTVTSSFEDYQNEIERIRSLYPEGSSPNIEVELGPILGYMIAQAETGHTIDDLPEDIHEWTRGPYYGYYLSGGMGYGYVGGCVRRTGNKHNLRIHRYGRQIFNLHTMMWFSGGRACMGNYESVSGWCRTNDCTPTYSDVVNAIIAAALLIGISYTAAVIIANVAAPLVFAAVLI